MSFKIADIYLKDKEVVAGPKKDETGNQSPAEVGEVKVGHDVLVSYCGKYEWQPGIFVTLSLENGILYVAAPELPKTPMAAVSATEFDVKPVSARVTFITEYGKVSKMQVKMNGGEVNAMKLPDFDPAKINLSEYTGNF